MASVDMAPRCTRCHVHHWPDSRHLGHIRAWLWRLRHR
jgi:hypothetical protein